MKQRAAAAEGRNGAKRAFRGGGLAGQRTGLFSFTPVSGEAYEHDLLRPGDLVTAYAPVGLLGDSCFTFRAELRTTVASYGECRKPTKGVGRLHYLCPRVDDVLS